MNLRPAACIALLAAAASAQDEVPSFHATSELMLLDVQVIHKKTQTAFGDLQAKDFDISEDGVPQKISFFGRDQLPLSIVLMFDLTQSDRFILKDLGKGARAALEHLRPEDEAAVMVYSSTGVLVGNLTTDRARTAAAITRAASMSSDEAAFFNQAVFLAASYLGQRANPSARRVLLWLTDNLPNYPTARMLAGHDKALQGALPHSEADAVRALHASQTVVMPLLLQEGFAFSNGERAMNRDREVYAHEHPSDKNYSAGDAKKYAEITGGFAFQLRGKKVQERLADIIDAIRTRYTIGYQPTESKPPGTFCRLNVALSPDAPLRPQEWDVLARAGYYRK
jgi:VWFA-related protein